jgi:hypothetical protein
MKDRIKDLILYAYMLRVPLLMVALIWPILPYLFTTALFRGLADLQSGGDVGTILGVNSGTVYVTFAAFDTLVVALTISYLIARYGPSRMAEQPLRLRYERKWLYWFGAVAAAAYVGFLWSLWQANRAFGPLTFIGGVLVGLFLAFGQMALSLNFVLPELVDSDPTPRNGRFGQLLITWAAVVDYLRTPLQKLLPKLGLGFYGFDGPENPTEMLPGTAFASGLFVVFPLIYLVARFSQDRHNYPTLFWILGLTTFVLWLVAIAAFWLDLYRAPVLMVLGGLVIVASIFFGSDSYYDTHDIRDKQVRLLTPSEVLNQPRFRPRMILVAAAGGGIHAAGWTARVLTGLKEDLGDRFDHKVAVVSGVSGGSVGSFFYLRSLAGYPRESLMPSEAFNGAVKSSLEDVALSLLRGDRGAALEQSFSDHAQARNADLHELATNVGKNFPVVIFNATMAQAARPLVFTNSAFPDDSRDVGALKGSIRSFDRQCANQDANVETAVRMSATFPFVSPAARAHLNCLSEHLVDGGYYDNYGLTSLNTWVRQAVGQERWEGKGTLADVPEILLLQIVSFPKDEDAALADEHWLYQLTVPVSVMLNVRGTGQTLRNQAESWAVMKNVESRGAKIHSVVFRYSPDDCACSATTPSLSWHLSTTEIRCIRTAWEESRMKPCRDAVANFVRNPTVKFPQLNVCQE